VASVKELSLPNDKGGKSRRARHGKFKVAGCVLSAEQVGNRAACERALEKAKVRAGAGQWPTIIATDF